MQASAAALARRYRLDWVGAVVCFAAVVTGWLRAVDAPDYAVMHAMAVGIAQRSNVYLLNAPNAVGTGVVGMVYPPATGFAVLPLALLPFGAGRVLWFAASNLSLIFGVRALVRSAAPRLAPLANLAAGLVLFSAAVRWGMMLLQPAPFILGLLCFSISAQLEGKRATALAIAIVAVAFKLTLGLAFVGLLLLDRRYIDTAIVGASWAVLDVLGFWRLGSGALETYRANVAIFEAITPVNINGPDPWMGITLPRLDWVYLFYGVTRNLPLSRILNLACAAFAAIWMLREAWRLKSIDATTRTYFTAALVCLGSLCVYHHQYDAGLFFAPLLLAICVAPSLFRPSATSWLTLPLVVVISIVPIGLTQSIIERTVGPRWVALLKMSFPVVLSLALVGALLGLRRVRIEARRGGAGVLKLG